LTSTITSIYTFSPYHGLLQQVKQTLAPERAARNKRLNYRLFPFFPENRNGISPAKVQDKMHDLRATKAGMGHTDF
jgi:hypothetical protein